LDNSTLAVNGDHAIPKLAWKTKALLPDVLSKSELAMAHSLYLQETADQSRYLMSDAERSLAAELALSGINAWSKLHGTIWSHSMFRLSGMERSSRYHADDSKSGAF
jgi:hypothetical protein